MTNLYKSTLKKCEGGETPISNAVVHNKQSNSRGFIMKIIRSPMFQLSFRILLNLKSK